MKLLITILGIILAINSGIAETVTHKFKTSGNCYMCKLRIEDAVNKLDGIVNVNWDYDNKITTVTYFYAHVNLHQIMLTIAAVGHDTEWYRANDSAYNFLIGTCCEYDREIDYFNVQIGYLSLENTWVNVSDADFSNTQLYPSIINQGYFNVELNHQNMQNVEIQIFAPTGQLVDSGEISPGFVLNKVNVSHLSSGLYYVLITEKNKNMFLKRIIVQ